MDKQIGNVQLMQQMNRLKVLDYIRRNPDVSRPCISENTGLSLASITNTTSYLLDIGLIYESGIEKVGRVGRKSVLLRFCPSNYNLICIYLNEKYTTIAYTDLEGNAKDKIKIETDKLSIEDTMTELCENILLLMKRHSEDKILGIGVSVSGLILDDSRFILSSQLKWKSFDIKKSLEEATSLPVFVDNLSLVKAMWYFFKNCNGSKENMLFIDMSNGIGAVQIFNAAISRSTLGEIGHTTVKSDGDPCFCGNKGCLEAMCSPQRLISLYEKLSNKKISSLAELDKLYKNEDKNAVLAISDCAKYLGIGLANLVNLFNPSVMIINSGDFENCPSLIKEAELEMNRRAYPTLTQKLSIKQTNTSEESIFFGTAFSLCDRLFDISYGNNIVK